MEQKDFEQLFIRSLDESLTTTESNQLNFAIAEDPICKKIADDHVLVRSTIKRKERISFGSEFTSSVLKALQQSIATFDHEMAFIFKKVQLLVAGVIICMLIVNVVSADELTLQSILAFDYFDTTTTATSANDDLTIDLSKFINDNNE